MHFGRGAGNLVSAAAKTFVISVNDFSVCIHKGGKNTVYNVNYLVAGTEILGKKHLDGFFVRAFFVFFSAFKLTGEYRGFGAAEIVNALLHIADGEKVVLFCNQREYFVLKLVCVLKFVYIYFVKSFGKLLCKGCRRVVFFVIKQIQCHALRVRKADHMPALFLVHESMVKFIKK